MPEMPTLTKSSTVILAAAVCRLGLAAPIAAQAADTQAIAAGKTPAINGGGGAPPCSACHGPDGGGQAASGSPRLAGLDPGYLHARLAAFASGARAIAMMGPIAKAMDAEAMADAAAYYASLRARSPAASTAGTRHDDPLGLMHAVASRLSDDQVAAVAAYHATLPGAAPASQGGAR